jgi:hypothetical protein
MRINKVITGLCAAAALVCLVTMPMFAHHGAAQFDGKKKIVLKGTIVVLHFTNPHVLITFEVKNAKGEAVQWIGELQAPNILIRGGWNKRTLQPGDAITVYGYPLKTGDPAVWVHRLTGPDGKDLPLFDY